VKRTLGPLRLLVALVLLALLAPSVTSAQEAARPAKSARAHRDSAHKARKKRARKAGGKNEPASEPVETGGASPAPPADKRGKRGKTRGRSETHAGEALARSEGGTSPAASAAASAAQQSAAGVNAQIVKEGDTSVKVMEFSGLGIEGRLKSPQLVYFTQRVRAEFERPQLPHRSFMPELEASTLREPVR
jgi:hypothetical protein